MVRFVARAALPLPVIASLLVALLVAVLAALSACGVGSGGSNAAQPPPESPSTPPSSVKLVLPPSLVSPAPRPPAPGLRPMTAWERQQKANCDRRLTKNGCIYFSDQSLRLQGVDPEATTPGG